LTVIFSKFTADQSLRRQRELFRDAFPETQGQPAASEEHYRWKFQSSPFDPHSYEYCATDGERLLGYYAAIPCIYQVGARQLRAGLVCDVMTDPAARGQGVFTGLGKFAVESLQASDLSFLTGYPIRPEVMGGHIRAGWQVAFDLPMYLRPLRTDAILRSKNVAWLAPLANLVVATYQRLLKPRPWGKEFTCSIGSPDELLRSAEFEEFVQKWSASVANHLVKSAQFYEWRLSGPSTRYDVFLVCRNGEVLAAAVGREVVIRDIPSFALLDVMVLDASRGALRTLYSEVEKEARARGAEAIVTMMSRQRARYHRLMRYGFIVSPFVFKLIVRSVDDEVSVESLADEGAWHLMWIDSDDL
jgi:hypothetical protein